MMSSPLLGLTELSLPAMPSMAPHEVSNRVDVETATTRGKRRAVE